MKAFSVLLLVVTLFSCADPMPQTVRGKLEDEGHSKAYIQGYSDGCQTWRGQSKGRLYGNIQDIERFQRDSQYRAGWDEGYDHCKTKDQPWDPALRIRE